MNKYIFLLLLVGLNLASADLFLSTLTNLVKPKAFPEQYKNKYFKQPINHFDPYDKRTFRQRYIEDCTYHEPNGPIIMVVSEPIGIFMSYINDGPVREIAEMHNGCLMQLEIRYSGESTPFKNFTLVDWKYFKVHQIIEDFASFIKGIKAKERRFKESKVVLVGLSMSATYVSWFRMIYPELSVGAWASSGAVHVESDGWERKSRLGYLYRQYGGEECYYKINNGFQAIEKDLKQDDMTRINKTFNICEGFNTKNEKDSEIFIQTLGSLYTSSVFINPIETIQDICQKMSQVDDEVEAIAAGLSSLIGPNCLEISYKSSIEKTQKEIDDPNSLIRSSYYLFCYQHGWWPTTKEYNQPFGTIVQLDYFVGMCRDIFRDTTITKESMEKTTKNLNFEYGSKRGNYTNLYTTHGEFDPIGIYGLGYSIIPSSIIENIKGASHANDLYYFTFEPTIPIKTAVFGAKYWISKWLQE